MLRESFLSYACCYCSYAYYGLKWNESIDQLTIIVNFCGCASNNHDVPHHWFNCCFCFYCSEAGTSATAAILDRGGLLLHFLLLTKRINQVMPAVLLVHLRIWWESPKVATEALHSLRMAFLPIWLYGNFWVMSWMWHRILTSSLLVVH